MKLPGSLTSSLSGPKRRGVAVTALVSIAIASVCGMVWGWLKPQERPEPQKHFCRLPAPQTPTPQVSPTPQAIPRPHRRADACYACGMG